MRGDPPLVPPLKCQGIKTKLVGEIQRLVSGIAYTRWVEPFCGSCVVPFNIQPKRALLSDTNVHIIRLYKDIQEGIVTSGIAKAFLIEEGEKLKAGGEDFYYTVRERFNEKPTSLDFLFLNRSCFNGVMRFNKKGKFNVPYCHKSERFAQSYITKITNQVRKIGEVIKSTDWEFVAQDFRSTLANREATDFVYADPPYAGRHVDYFNSWSDEDEIALADALKRLPCKFMLSTWHSNEFRTNNIIPKTWTELPYHIIKREHFYHVGSSEDLRHPMIEALITNFPTTAELKVSEEQMALL